MTIADHDFISLYYTSGWTFLGMGDGRGVKIIESLKNSVSSEGSNAPVVPQWFLEIDLSKQFSGSHLPFNHFSPDFAHSHFLGRIRLLRQRFKKHLPTTRWRNPF
jgi:hypothetical protein